MSTDAHVKTRKVAGGLRRLHKICLGTRVSGCETDIEEDVKEQSWV